MPEWWELWANPSVPPYARAIPPLPYGYPELGRSPIITFINLRISGAFVLIHLITDYSVRTRVEVTAFAPTWRRWFKWLRGRQCLAGYAWRFRHQSNYYELPFQIPTEHYFVIPIWQIGTYRWIRFRYWMTGSLWSVFSPTWAVLIPT